MTSLTSRPKETAFSQARKRKIGYGGLVAALVTFVVFIGVDMANDKGFDPAIYTREFGSGGVLNRNRK